MIETDTRVDDAVGLLRAGIDACLGLDLDLLDREALLDLAREVETQRRRMPAIDHRMIAAVESRGVAHDCGAASTTDLLRQLLRLTGHEAAGRVKAAAELGPRRGLTGEALPPLFAAVASAQAAGTVTAVQARTITALIDRLPAEVDLAAGTEVQAFLVEQAQLLDARQLAQVAERLHVTLDPDGSRCGDADRQRRRQVNLAATLDGTGYLTGTLTPEALAVWQAILDSLAAPVPADEDGQPDRRTAGQRRHDAVLEAGMRILRSGALPDAGGSPVTILAVVDADQLRAGLDGGEHSRADDCRDPNGRGYSTTGHGNQLSVSELLALGCEARLVPVLCSKAGGILGYGSTRRLASPGQRLALAARDRGCSFPGCARPPAWCAAHHVTSWIDGGLTDLDNLTLVCGYHHRNFEALGWGCVMIDGYPHWIPPARLDKQRRPRRNANHHTDIDFAGALARVTERFGGG